MKKSSAVIFGIAAMTTTVFAATSALKYKGFDMVNVTVNGTLLKTDVPAIIMDGRTLLPLRKVVESVNGLVTWDGKNKTAVITKPQVNIMFTESKNGVTSVGELVETFPVWSESDKFISHISIGNLLKGHYTINLAIYKYNESTRTDEKIDFKPDTVIDISEDNRSAIFASPWELSKIKKSGTGTYKFAVMMKDTSDKFQTIASYHVVVK
ncbi:MAG: copper amine oxidase N-terminal domain-containing protein [Clostridia bacterium]|nr:copper amine oxidase N-terminal domain-containing protein [Clostridia bacterium]